MGSTPYNGVFITAPYKLSFDHTHESNFCWQANSKQRQLSSKSKHHPYRKSWFKLHSVANYQTPLGLEEVKCPILIPVGFYTPTVQLFILCRVTQQ